MSARLKKFIKYLKEALERIENKRYVICPFLIKDPRAIEVIVEEVLAKRNRGQLASLSHIGAFIEATYHLDDVAIELEELNEALSKNPDYQGDYLPLLRSDMFQIYFVRSFFLEPPGHAKDPKSVEPCEASCVAK